MARDKACVEQLGALGWHVIVVWECQLKDHDAVMRRLRIELFSEDSLKELERIELLAAEEMGVYRTDH